MSKSTHDRELARARDKRRASASVRKQSRTRFVAIGLILALGGAVFVGAAMSGSSDDPDLAAITDPITPSASQDPAAGACPSPQGAPASPFKSYDAAPEMVIDAALTYTASIETTCGTIVVELAAAQAPVTVNNFVFLARDGYYDGAPFHRVIDDFMIQGGDPSGTGSGEGGTYPGYTFDDELALAESIVAETGGYPRGAIAMANSGANTNGSQFFIMQVSSRPAYPLPAAYSIFGQTLQGLDVVDKIVQGPATGDSALDPVRIISITITEA
jgi:cyclophilin family peptidyl-prolyl cis-trans isomerase